MRRIAFAVMSTISGLVLLFSYHTSTNSGTVVAAKPSGGTGASGPAGSSSSASSPSSSGSSGSSAPSASSGSSGSSSSSSSSSGSSTASGTYTGTSANTRWGPVQVQITVQNGKITAAQAVVYPQNNGRDVQINSEAVPTYNQEVVQAQSAQIDAISGATVTYNGYVQSLQSALDQAHL